MLHNPNWTKPLTKTQQTLLDAAALIEKHGHVKHDMGDVDRGFCISGAIRHAAGYKERSFENWIDAFHEVLKVIPEPVEWNNAPERTGAEVIAVLREAAHAV